ITIQRELYTFIIHQRESEEKKISAGIGSSPHVRNSGLLLPACVSVRACVRACVWMCVCVRGVPSWTVTPQLSHWMISSASSLLSPRHTPQIRIGSILWVVL